MATAEPVKPAALWLEPLPVPVTGANYMVEFGIGVLHEVPAKIISRVRAHKYIIITDENVAPLHGRAFKAAFEAQASAQQRGVHMHVVPAGEASKCRAVKARIEEWMLSVGCGRDTCVVGLGGGVVGDLSGFVASTYMRGVPLVHVPTTTLAMCDSSIGGKTGIDTPSGKNLVGAFHQPKAVFMDMALLRTLPLRELCNGTAEAIKAGAISSASLFSFIENNTDALLALDLEAWAQVIRRSVEIKAQVVVEDEREGGVRAILNFGHSVGHAVEALCQPDLLHGECVAIGMMQEAILARSLGHLPTSAIGRLDQCLRGFHLPTLVPPHLSVAAILHKMEVDKKNTNGQKKIVMLTTIGDVLRKPYTIAVADELLQRLLCTTASVLPGVARGEVAVPGSKSVSNRILQITAMGHGTCRIRGLLHSEDTQVMLDSLRKLGVEFSWEENEKVLVMTGCGGRLSLERTADRQVANRSLYLGNAGTASRFLTTLCTTIEEGVLVLSGNSYLHKRPVAHLVDALRSVGCDLKYQGQDGCLPVQITCSGGFPGGEIRLGANVSSQYVSSVLLSAPFAKEPVTLRLDKSKEVVSGPYIDMTVDLMRQFGAEVTKVDPWTYTVAQGGYTNPSTFLVEGDASSATYPLALAAVSGGSVSVTNVGSVSLQGDAQFFTLLEKMGCKVKQTDMETNVEGPADAADLHGIDVDMDTMTDSFMTLCAVASVATGVTRISNIANQRVKECNRLAAMVTELRKIGIDASELETGIQVTGAGAGGRQALKPTLIDCRHDHRIAMSFAVLGARVPGLVVDSKSCVDKTYTTFWDDIQGHLGLRLDDKSALEALVPCRPPVGWVSAPKVRGSSEEDRASKAFPSIVIIGMRGAGKTTLGGLAANQLGAAFHDVDAAVEAEVGTTIKEFISATSWASFRAKELAVFSSLVKEHPYGCVISCGGGIIETKEAADILQALPLVVEVRRHIEDIEAYLAADPSRPAYDAEVRAVYDRRKPLFAAASSHTFVTSKGDTDWQAVGTRWTEFLRRITGLQGAPKLSEGTFFLSLTYPRIEDAVADLKETAQGVDALELRVDLLGDVSEEGLTSAVGLLRQHSKLPIIFTVRSQSQGGKFPDDEAAIWALMRLGLKLGCEFVDVESHLSPDGSSALHDLIARRYPHVLVIGSHHVPDGNGGDESDLGRIFAMCSQRGRADVVKVVISATCPADVIRLLHVASQHDAVPSIVLAMREEGKLTRVWNQVLTPVTHPKLPSAAAPGQMSVNDIQRARSTLGILQPRSFYLFGTPVSASPSPLMHNSGFEWCGLPHRYEARDTDNVEDVVALIRGKEFGGASVTIPLKERIAAHLDQVSPSAQAIGAVNTIVRGEGGSLTGDNTDWIGICEPLRPLLQGRAVPGQGVAVVVGAGGTARAALFALQKLGFSGSHLLVVNPRTSSKAEALAAEFGCGVASFTDAGTLRGSNSDTDLRVSVCVCTIPASAAFELPAAVIRDQPIVFDVSYVPDSLLSAQAAKAGCPLVRGLDMLIAQGQAQFELWTGRRNEQLFDHMDNVVRQRK